MTSRRHAAAAIGVLAVLVVAGGCGGDDEDGDEDFVKLPGTTIAEVAKADMKSLDQVKFTGSITTTDQQITLDVRADANGDCTGTVGLGGGTAEILAKDGTNWFRPDEEFWRGTAPQQADAIVEAVGDKWVLDTNANFAQFCDLDAFFDNLFKTDDRASTYKTAGTDTVDGQDVVRVEQSDEQGTATGYVLVSGKHYLVKLERTEGDQPGHLDFSEFDQDFEVTAPADDDVIDLDSLQ
jgi:hypothetical protein